MKPDDDTPTDDAKTVTGKATADLTMDTAAAGTKTVTGRAHTKFTAMAKDIARP